MKYNFVLLVCLTMLFASTAVTSAQTAATMPEGASFSQINLHKGYPQDLGKTDENRSDELYLDTSIGADNVWLYTPSTPTTNIMYAPVFLYYANVQSEEAAWEAVTSAGIQQKAEELDGYAVVIGKNNGDTFNEADVQVFKGVLYYMTSEGTPVASRRLPLGYIPWGLSFDQRVYVLAEGEAANFVTDYLAQNAQRIAAACLVNASAPANVDGTLPLPAYLVAAADETVDYFKTLNAADAEKTVLDNTVYYNSSNDICQVIIGAGEALTPDVVDAFYNEIGQDTARMCLTTAVYLYSNFRTSDPYILTRLPNLANLDMILFSHTEGVLDGAAEISEWYEYVPNTVLNETGDTKYPLMVVAHGSNDHPQFEAESQGWVTLGGKQKMVVLTFRHQSLSGGTAVSDILALIDAIIEKYPIDESRIYMAGFSMGGGRTGSVVLAEPEKFAAAVILHSTVTGRDEDGNGKADQFETLADSVGLPLYLQCGEKDQNFTTGFAPTINNFALLNNLDYAIDLNSYIRVQNLHGLSIADSTSAFIGGMQYVSKKLFNDESVPMIQFNLLVNADHVHFAGNAEHAWDYIRQFTRNADGTLTYTHKVK